MSVVIATDISGTFTDLVDYDAVTKLVVHAKLHTEPENLTAGIVWCLQKSGLKRGLAYDFVHGSTVAINTAIERKGAATAVIVTRDVYVIGRGNRPEPYVPRSRTFEVDERLVADGTVVVVLDQVSVCTAPEAAVEAESESIGVCLLHSYASPEHELAVADLARQIAPDTYLSLSHEISASTGRTSGPQSLC